MKIVMTSEISLLHKNRNHSKHTQSILTVAYTGFSEFLCVNIKFK
jgi:hypothetical protein